MSADSFPLPLSSLSGLELAVTEEKSVHGLCTVVHALCTKRCRLCCCCCCCRSDLCSQTNTLGLLDRQPMTRLGSKAD